MYPAKIRLPSFKVIRWYIFLLVLLTLVLEVAVVLLLFLLLLTTLKDAYKISCGAYIIVDIENIKLKFHNMNWNQYEVKNRMTVHSFFKISYYIQKQTEG